MVISWEVEEFTGVLVEHFNQDTHHIHISPEFSSATL